MNAALVTMTIDQIETKITELETENAALKARLEFDPSRARDGISCRDETIKMLEEELNKAASFAVRCDHDNAGLRADLEDAEKEIAELKERLK